MSNIIFRKGDGYICSYRPLFLAKMWDRLYCFSSTINRDSTIGLKKMVADLCESRQLGYFFR